MPASQARLDRFIGYYEPYATSHDALDRDEAVQEETRNVARAVARVTAALRAGELDDAIAARCRAAAEIGRFIHKGAAADSASRRERVILVCCTAAKCVLKASR